MTLTARDFMAQSIKAHEGGLSMRPDDNGNWFDKARFKQGLRPKRDIGVLVGSKFGVTAYALATYRHIDDVPAFQISSLTFNEAVDIAEQLYVKAPRFDQLPLNRVTLSIIDKGWMSGPGSTIQILQRLIGAKVDGGIGPGTLASYKAWLAKLGEEGAARAWCAAREAYDQGLATNEGPNDKDKAFIRGWNNRSESFLPGTAWWKSAV